MSVRSVDPAPFPGRKDALEPAVSPARAALLEHVPFTRVVPDAQGLGAVEALIAGGDLKAGGPATRRCAEAISAHLGGAPVLMVSSCTTALELAALLLDVQPGDEIVMPSFGYVSAANAFVLRGGVPVFVDVLPGTLAIDPAAARAAVGPRTRAIVVVHYAGVAADMHALQELAAEHGLPIVEDAAQALGATHDGRPLGAIGTLGAFSFDATKNLTCGTGGALVVNDPALRERAERLRDCGTDRASFLRGDRARYEWTDLGTNGALNEIAAAYLAPQLEQLAAITDERRALWDRYHAALEPLEAAGLMARPVVPAAAGHNAHAYVITLPAADGRAGVIERLRELGVQATFHFVPLHSAPAGRQYARQVGELRRTEDLAGRLLRLPLWREMEPSHVDHVVRALGTALGLPAEARFR